MTITQKNIINSLVGEVEALARSVTIAKLALADEKKFTEVFADTFKLAESAGVDIANNFVTIMNSVNSDKLKEADEMFPGYYDKLRADLFDLTVKNGLFPEAVSVTK